MLKDVLKDELKQEVGITVIGREVGKLWSNMHTLPLLHLPYSKGFHSCHAAD